MQDPKSLFGQAGQSNDVSCNDLFVYLVSQIQKLPSERRGTEALRLTSQLLEFAAFELAGTLGSEKAGALIECAAQLSGQSDGSNGPVRNSLNERRRALH